MKKIVEFSNDEQTKSLNKILQNQKDKYSLYDIFENLPFDITYNGKRGYLSISHRGIAYTSISYKHEKINVVFAENIYCSTKDIFDSFIKTLQWFKKNESSIVVNFWD